MAESGNWLACAAVLLTLLATVPLYAAELPASPPADRVPAEAAAASPEDLRNDELRSVVTSWASAWQSQMDDVYLLHYHPDFVPEGFASRAEWETLRRSRMSAQENIRISLREFQVVDASADIAVVRFQLVYSRPGYADQTLKELRLRLDGLIWRIERENNLDVVRLPPP